MPFAIPGHFMNYSFNIICLINYYWTQVTVAGENGSLKRVLIHIRYPESGVLLVHEDSLVWCGGKSHVGNNSPGTHLELRHTTDERWNAVHKCSAPGSDDVGLVSVFVLVVDGHHNVPTRDAHFGCRAIQGMVHRTVTRNPPRDMAHRDGRN